MRFLYSIVAAILLLFYGGIPAFGQVSISGTVKDDADNPVIGATLTLISTGNQIAATNSNGAFSISVPAGSTILVRSLGYESKRITVNANQSTYHVVLSEMVSAIEETVVVGYQVRDKTTLTGSAVVITAEDIKDVPSANFTDLLQGKVAGLNIQLNNGTPGMRGNIALRGISNINIQGSGYQAFLTPTSPLFVIDGVPLDENNNY